MRKRTGLPPGEVSYSDSQYWQRVPKPLYDASLKLAGKPDYILKSKQDGLVLVELKSANAPQQPWDSHIIQLAAYCHLVGKNFGIRPAYGIIQYRDKSFRVPYTEAVEIRLMELIEQMRQVEIAASAGCSPDRSHRSPSRCRGCGFASICDQKL